MGFWLIVCLTCILNLCIKSIIMNIIKLGRKNPGMYDTLDILNLHLRIREADIFKNMSSHHCSGRQTLKWGNPPSSS